MELETFHKEIPTWDNGTWTETIYDSREEFVDFISSCFKEPGKYEFDETTKEFNAMSRFYKENGFYSMTIRGTKDFRLFWDFEKKKCINGVIYKNKEKVWYLPREYYMWLNYLPIFDKMKKKYDFASVWDVQMHIALYEYLAELNYKHAIVLKKRQIASSYYHCAKLINRFWFDEGAILKMGASLKDFVNLNGSWKFLDEYKNFLNSKTAWNRPLNPNRTGDWQQKIEIKKNGRIYTHGLKSTLVSRSFEKSPTTGVGGPCHRIGTKIIMADGKPKSVEDIKIGDYILGIDSKPKIVTNTFLGQAPMYKIEPIKGNSFYATGEHILALYTELFDVEVNVKVSDWNNLTDTLKNYLFQKRYNNLKNNNSFELVPIKSITLQNYGYFEQYAGIEVEDSHYFLDDFTITHNCSLFFYEEAGIAPTMDKTYIYMKAAMEMGDLITGQFIAAGSVGELKDCEPLKQFIMNPEINGFYGVETDLLDEKGTKGKRGLFIPEQWGMPPYIDEFGNSQVKEALNALNVRFEKSKKELTPAMHQLDISQHPRNIKEAFAYREESKFPLNILETQQIDIESNNFPFELVDLEKNIRDEIVVKKTNKPPIDQFPVSMNLEDKTGSIQVWEMPDKDAKFGTYLASVDPVAVGKSTTSDSLAAIYVYKRATIVKRNSSLGPEQFIEGDKIVCSWCGRFDELDNTFKRLSLIIEWYNAYTLVENNINSFILYMIKEKKQRFLVPKDQILFLKETNSNRSVYKDYGYTRTKELWNRMFPMFIDWISETIDEEFDELGNSVKKYFGIRRIPDIMAIKEMFAYNDTINTDRLSSLIPLVAFIKIQDANYTIPVRVEEEEDNNFENNKNLYKLNKEAFSFLGRKSSNMSFKKMKNPFRFLK